MALQRQTIDVPLGGGLETSVDPRLVPQGKVPVLTNCDFSSTGVLTKRPDFTARVDNVPTTTGTQLRTFQDQLLLCSSNKLYAYSQYAVTALAEGDFRQTTSAVSLISDMSQPIHVSDIAYSADTYLVGAGSTSSVIVYTYTERTTTSGSTLTSYTSWVSAYDARTGRTVMTPVSLGATTATVDFPVKLLTLSSGIVMVIYKAPTSQLISFAQVTESSGILSLTARFDLSNAHNTCFFDVCQAPASTFGAGLGLIAYRNTTPTITVRSFTPLAAGSGINTTIASDVDQSIAIARSTTTAFSVFYATSTGGVFVVRYAGTTPTSATITTEISNADLTAASSNGVTSTTMAVWTSTVAGVRKLRAQFNTFITSGATDNMGTVVSRPFQVPELSGYSNSWFVQMLGRNNTYYTVLLINQGATTTIAGTVVARQCDGNVDPFWTSTVRPKNHSANVHQITAENATFVTAGQAATTVRINSASPDVRAARITLGFSALRSNGGTNAPGPLLVLASGEPAMYDGVTCCELGFNATPIVTLNAASASGGSMSDGTYLVKAVYGWLDHNGDAHYSPTSSPLTVTLSGGGSSQKYTVDVTTMTTTRKGTYFILLYSTVGSGTAYYLVNSSSVLSSAAVVSTIAIARTATDATTLTGPQIYTVGGVPDSVAPPSATSAVTVGQRTFLYVGGSTLWFSQKHVPGTGLQFSDVLTKQLIADRDSPVTLAEMDGNVIAFSERQIQFFAGEGPAQNGTNDLFTEPRLISSDVGIIPGTPTAKTSMGIFFRSPRGLSLLTRSLEVQYIGQPVSSFNAASTSPLSSTPSIVALPSLNQVRFGDSVSAMKTLVYDYATDAWSQYTIQSRDAVAYEDKYETRELYNYLPSTDGITLYENTAYTAQAFAMSVKTPWLHLAGLQGFKRIYYVSILGEWADISGTVDNVISLAVYYNYSLTATETVTFTLTQAMYDAGGPLQVRHMLGHQCEAVQFLISDVSGPLKITGLSLDVGVIGGQFRQPSAQTI